MFEKLCHIHLDLRHLCKQPLRNRDRKYYQVNYEIEFTFGTVECQARVKWTENVRLCAPERHGY